MNVGSRSGPPRFPSFSSLLPIQTPGAKTALRSVGRPYANLLEKTCLQGALGERSAATANRRPGETPCKKSKPHSA